MKALMLSLVAGVTLYGGVQLADTIVPKASEATSYTQGRLVSDAAYLRYLLGTPWEEALAVAVSDTRHNEGQLTVTGTTVRWDNGIDVWCVELPTPDSLVKPERCL
jgi:hypothetical protein